MATCTSNRTPLAQVASYQLAVEPLAIPPAGAVAIRVSSIIAHIPPTPAGTNFLMYSLSS